jgi:hypothetical protein
VTRTASSRGPRDREAARRAAQEAALLDAHRRAARRRGIIGIGVIVGVVLAVVLVIRGAAGEKERKDARASTTAAATTSTLPAAPLVSLPTPPPGATAAGTAACPPADGSAARTTRFEQAPPTCLDPQIDYEATIRTSKGPLRVNLNEQSSPEAVNAFVVLARYHYYDGLPVTTVRRGAFAEVGDPAGGPGFRLPATGKRESAVLTSLLVGLTPQSGTTGGGLTIGMPGDQFTAIPPDTSVLGMIMDARPDQRPGAPDDQRNVTQFINDAASASGAPSQVITIDGVDIAECRLPSDKCQRT